MDVAPLPGQRSGSTYNCCLSCRYRRTDYKLLQVLIIRTLADDRLYKPGIGLSNKVYRQHPFNVWLNRANGYAVYGYYTEQQSLTPPITRPTKSVGINFNYTRGVRSDVRGYGSVGYADTVNSPATVFTTSTTNFNTITGAVGVNYLPSQF